MNCERKMAFTPHEQTRKVIIYILTGRALQQARKENQSNLQESYIDGTILQLGCKTASKVQGNGLNNEFSEKLLSATKFIGLTSSPAIMTIEFIHLLLTSPSASINRN